MDKDKGYICPCCGLFVKRYTRKFNANMALALLLLNKYRGKFMHVESLAAGYGYKRCGDASYLKHYGLIEALSENRKDGSNRNGYYRITELGIGVCELKIKFKEKFLIFNNACDGFAGKDITLKDALGIKFNYNELMGYVDKIF